MLAAASPSLAQVTPPPVASGFATIKGVVVDSIRQQPLSKAVIVVDGTSRITMADGAGNYRIDSIPPGRYRLSISHPVLDTLGMSVVTPPMVMRPNETIEVDLATPSPARVVAMRCPPGMLQRFGPGALMGQVSDPDSLKAAVGSKVQLVYQETLLGFKGQPIVREAIVDSSGSYKI